MPEPALTPELALSYLDELSTDIRAAVLVDESGAVAAHRGLEDSGPRVAELATELFERAERAAGRPVPQLEVVTPEGAVFGVRDDRWALVVVAGRFTLPSVMFYDLRNVLSDLGRTPA